MVSQARRGSGSVALEHATSWRISLPAETWILAGVTLIGAVLRLATLGTQSYWLDEAQTVQEMHLSLGALLHAVRVNETTPQLYFVLAWAWSKLFGTGEVGLRSLSALAGTVVIPVTYICGRELVSRNAGLIAAALAAVNPFMIWYSQEARSYMLLGVLCGASFLFFVRCVREPTTRNLAWWTTFSALALLTHFFAGFLVAPEALGVLWLARSRRAWVAAGVIFLVQVALLPLALSDTSQPLGWIKAIPLSTRIQQAPTQLGLGALYQSSQVTRGVLGASVLALCVVALLAGWGDRQGRRGAVIASTIAALAVVVPLALAALGHDYFVPRNLMPAWIPLAVVIGAACVAPRARPAGAALAAVLLAAFVYAGIRIDGDAQYQRPDWRGVAAALGPTSGQRAIVAYDGAQAAGPLAVYMPGTRSVRSNQAPVTISEVDVVGSTWQTMPRALPTGTRLSSEKVVNNYLVERFRLEAPRQLRPAEIASRAEALLGPAPPQPAVLIQDSVQ